MADADSSQSGEPWAETDEEATLLSPLTRRGYKRTAAAQRQITQAATLDAADLIAQAQQRDESADDFLSPEALVYFIRRADIAGDAKMRDALFRELLERCTVFFRSQFRGCSKEQREDLQAAVMGKVVEDLLDPGDRGDFMQARFWDYLKRRCTDAWRAEVRWSSRTESLNTEVSGGVESEGRTKLDAQEDVRLNPEQVTMLSDALATLPARLRQMYLLRHYVGMMIGADNPADDPPHELTLARRFECSGRTIRNRLKEADRLLARFRED